MCRGYRLSLSTLAFCFRVCAHRHERGRLTCHLTPLLQNMDQLRAVWLARRIKTYKEQKQEMLVEMP